LPAPGQGAVAIEARAGSPAARLAARLDDAATRAAVEAERGFLLAIGGGCSVPVGALGRPSGGRLELEAVIADPESGTLLRDRLEGDTAGPGRIGAELAL